MNSFLLKILCIQFLGISLNVFYYYPQALYWYKPWPESTPMFGPYDWVYGVTKGVFGVHLFGDLWVTYLTTKSPSPYLVSTQSFLSNYFPATHLILKPFVLFDYSTCIYLLFTVCILINLVIVFDLLKKLPWLERTAVTFFIGIFNYAIYFTLDRGNIEIIVLSLLFLFIHSFVKGNFKTAGFFLGLATSMKLYPGLFALLLLKRKEKNGIAAFLATGFFVTLGALATFQGGIWANTLGLLECLRGFQQGTGAGIPGVQYSSSYFALFKSVYFYLQEFSNPFFFLLSYPFKWIAEIHTTFAFIVLFYFVRKNLKENFPLWMECLIYSCLLIVLPKISFDYRLCYLLVPFVLMVRQATEDTQIPPILMKLAQLLSLLLLPKTFFILLSGTGYALGLSSIINPAILLTVLYLISKIKSPAPQI